MTWLTDIGDGFQSFGDQIVSGGKQIGNDFAHGDILNGIGDTFLLPSKSIYNATGITNLVNNTGINGFTQEYLGINLTPQTATEYFNSNLNSVGLVVPEIGIATMGLQLAGIDPVKNLSGVLNSHGFNEAQYGNNDPEAEKLKSLQLQVFEQTYAPYMILVYGVIVAYMVKK
jgi:hypothetical protein